MTRTHTHPCRHCQTPVECHGEWVQNYDGFPDVVCDSYHLAGGIVALVLCHSCEDAQRKQDSRVQP